MKSEISHVRNFASQKFRFTPDCESLQENKIRTRLGLSKWRRNAIFLLWKGCIKKKNFFGLHHDLDFALKKFCPVVGLWRSFRNSGLDVDRKLWQSATSASHAQKMSRDEHWPEEFVVNLAAIQCFDGFGFYSFCFTRFLLNLTILFWTSAQLSFQFGNCRLWYWKVWFSGVCQIRHD